MIVEAKYISAIHELYELEFVAIRYAKTLNSKTLIN